MDNNVLWHWKTIIDRAVQGLNKNNLRAVAAENTGDAVKKVLEYIDPKGSVGVGGSQTVLETGLVEALEKRAQNLVLHKPGMALEQSLEIRRKALTADYYLASPNAVTLDGKLLFTDGVGNRVSGVIFGPRKVVLVAGVNKIVNDESSGWQRIRLHAAPANAKRLGIKTPCTVTGKCEDCSSEQRICNVDVIVKKKQRYTDYFIVLVPEELGY